MLQKATMLLGMLFFSVYAFCQAFFCLAMIYSCIDCPTHFLAADMVCFIHLREGGTIDC